MGATERAEIHCFESLELLTPFDTGVTVEENVAPVLIALKLQSGTGHEESAANSHRRLPIASGRAHRGAALRP